MILRGLLAVLFSTMVVGCGEGMPDDAELDPIDVASDQQAVTTVSAQEALSWGLDWIDEVKAAPSRMSENHYTASSTELERMVGTKKASNRNVCGTLVTKLMQKSLGLDPDDFYQSFNKEMDGCSAGTVDGEQKGTNSPNAAQYRYKIANCGGTGPIKFTKRTTIGGVRTGDVLAVTYPDRTDITGHVMIVRAAPIADKSLPAGPSGSTPYAVKILDSTSTPHGSSSKYPDYRGGNTGEGLGTGTFVLYANSDGAIVASRWSPTDSTLAKASTNRIAIGGLR